MGLLTTAITGINAAQLALLTTEHNIANASTPGYSRQRIIQTAQTPVFTGAGFIGQGTRVSTIERQYSSFLTTQVNQSQTNASELGKYLEQVSMIDNLLADPSAGLSPALQDFFQGIQRVATDPASLPARQVMIASAQSLQARFRSLENRLSEIFEGINGQIVSTVGGINSLAAQIGELNERIIVAAAGTDHPPNDLLDQRDHLITELNKLVRVQVVIDPTGAYNVFAGNGQQLVVGSTVNSFAVEASPSDTSRKIVGLRTGNGVQILPESTIVGGELGGLIRFRSEALDTSSNQLGQIAASLTSAFNSQHALGQDLLGQIAGDSGFTANFFTPLTPALIADSANSAGSTASAAYTDPIETSEGFYSHLTTSDYRLVAVAGGGGNTFTLTRLSDNALIGGAGPHTIDELNAILSDPANAAYDPQGFTISVSGIAEDDKFLIRPTREAARNFGLSATVAADPRLIAAAAPVRGQGAGNNVGTARVVSVSVGAGYLASSGAGLPMTLTYDSTTRTLAGFPAGTEIRLTNAGAANGIYAIADTSTQVPFQTGASIAIVDPAAPPATVANAITLQIDGLPTGGDRFVIERNFQGVSDARNAVKLGMLQTQNIMSGQNATMQGTYATLISDIGNRTQSARVMKDAQETLFAQAVSVREAASGVNLDEEAANLVRYQQAYQAAAKSLEIGARLFDEILALGR